MKDYLGQAHYAAIVAILRAGGVAARIVGNAGGLSISVGLSEGGVILWSNASQHSWRYSSVDADGNLVGYDSKLDWTATPEDVAWQIATYDYLSPVGEDLTEEE